MAQKPLVLILGPAGHTGDSIVEGLLESGNYRVAGLVRPSSLTKPSTEKLRQRGVEIRAGDLKDSMADLKKHLEGVDIVVSCILAMVVLDQKDLIRAAKEVGVKRFIPCDWATPGQRGIRPMGDMKGEIRDFIVDIGLPHTFIDVGWWMQLFLPLPARSKREPEVHARVNTEYAGGTTPTALTDLRTIGRWVARIIADPRTLNHPVLICEDERTQKDAFEIGCRLSGEAESLAAKRISISAEEIESRFIKFKAASEASENPMAWEILYPYWTMAYVKSIYVMGENSIASAKKIGYLDAQALYPDMTRTTLESFAEWFYALEEPAYAHF
ncbi:NAD-P-binding protein [Epithele typhae]|uniref:NAD-P-binding protein n=1 Tax=Epithele typhae TaxID=378194 RepID=UPI002008C2E4|nr:NAD-P-binding protein [Epithele typhae]KAH9925918.1 NAD-P-binding protein [Epithele typhae]